LRGGGSAGSAPGGPGGACCRGGRHTRPGRLRAWSDWSALQRPGRPAGPEQPEAPQPAAPESHSSLRRRATGLAADHRLAASAEALADGPRMGACGLPADTTPSGWGAVRVRRRGGAPPGRWEAPRPNGPPARPPAVRSSATDKTRPILCRPTRRIENAAWPSGTPASPSEGEGLG
jgi:hypothetical protein